MVFTQITNNLISQAADMKLHGITNDLMQNIDPITIIVFIPIMDRLIYPALRRVGIPFKPITRIFFGFMFGTLAMAYAAFVQHLIYKSGPCYSRLTGCEAAQLPNGDSLPNVIHVAIQTPAYAFIGLSEIFALITALEYAYTKAPVELKSFVISLFMLTSAFGSALAIALTPTAEDPKLTWTYTGLAVACFCGGVVFWFLYRKYNEAEEEMNEMDKNRAQLPARARNARADNEARGQSTEVRGSSDRHEKK